MDADDIRKAGEIGRSAAMAKLSREAIGHPDLMPLLRKYTSVKDFTQITKAFYAEYDKEAETHVNETHSDNQ